MKAAELSRLAHELAAAVGEGRHGALIIEGAVGSGRTRALEGLAAALREESLPARVLRGARAEADVPLAAVGALVPDFDTAGEDLPTARERLVALLRATDRPVAWCIDDADLLDAKSLAVLAFAARRGPCVLVASARSGAAIAEALPEAMTVWLPPLPDSAVRELVGTAASVQPIAEVREWIVQLADGNPGAAIDLARSLSAEQLVGVVALIPLEPTPKLWARFVAPLVADDAERAIALLLACEPRAPLALVERAAAVLGVESGAIDALQAAGRVAELGGRLHLAPPVAGVALYSVALATERIAAHRALAEASVPTSHRRVWHAAQAATEPDETLAAELERSTQPVFRRGGVIAVSEILERAAALSPEPEERGRRLAAAAEAAWLAGHPERGRALLFAAQDQSLALPLRTEVAYLRGSIELASGSVDYAMTVLRDAAAERLGSTMAASAAAPLLIRAMDAAVSAGDVAQAVAIGHMAQPLVDDPDPVCANRAACVVGTGRLMADDLDGLRLTERVTATSATDAEQSLALVAMRTALAGGDVRRLSVFAAATADRLRESGSVGQLTFATSRQALAELLLGRLDNAAAIAVEGQERSVVLGQSNSEAEHLAVLALATARRGDWDDAVATAERALRLATTHGLAWPAAIATWAMGELELSRGGAGEALARLDTLWHGRARERHPLIALFAAPELVEAAVRAGMPERGDLAFARLVRWAEAAGHAWAGALVERCHVLRATDADGADEAFERALVLHAQAARPFDLARTQLAYGERLRRDRRRAECRRPLRFALEGFENVGAAAWEERARLELRASGETLRRRNDGNAVDALTPQERTIARLVAEGRTNRDVAAQLFLSVRTVEFHLRNVFLKLDVSSRVELVGFAGALEAGGS